MDDFRGLKVFVVEDDETVAFMIEAMLAEIGFEIGASAARIDDACRVAREAAIDFAVLDLNLRGESVVPVAEILRDRQIPFVFSSGYGADGVVAEFKSYPALCKPFQLDELCRAASTAIEQRKHSVSPST